jgi:hypothetical protein
MCGQWAMGNEQWAMEDGKLICLPCLPHPNTARLRKLSSLKPLKYRCL